MTVQYLSNFSYLFDICLISVDCPISVLLQLSVLYLSYFSWLSNICLISIICFISVLFQLTVQYLSYFSYLFYICLFSVDCPISVLFQLSVLYLSYFSCLSNICLISYLSRVFLILYICLILSKFLSAIIQLAVYFMSHFSYLFFSDNNKTPRDLPKIVRSYMDGSNRQNLKLGKIVSPTSLTVDIAARWVIFYMFINRYMTSSILHDRIVNVVDVNLLTSSLVHCHVIRVGAYLDRVAIV